MFTLKIQNSRRELYELTHNRSQYTVLEVSGLTLPQCNVHTSSSGLTDGEEYNSSHLNRRNLVITVALEGDIDTSRQQLYRMFPLHSPVTVFYQTGGRDVQITGYPEIVDGSLFSARETMQISIICPNPFWQDMNGISAEFRHETVGFSFPFTVSAEGNVISGIWRNPEKIVINNGDCTTGFTAAVSIDANREPSLTSVTTQSDTPDQLRDKTALLTNNDIFDNMSFASQTVNVYVNDVLKTLSSEYTRELLTAQTGHRELWLQFPGGGLQNAELTVEVITVDGQTVTDMRYWCSPEFTLHRTVTVGSVPSWFDLDADNIVFAFVSGAVGRAVPDSMTAVLNADGTYTITATFESATGEQLCECRIYGSISKTDVHDATIVRTINTWNFGTYTRYIVNSVLPEYTARDMLRVYKGETLLQDTQYHFTALTRADSSSISEFILDDSLVINEKITFEAVKSIAGDDIHDYTNERIDEGFLLVDGLTFTNLTTGEFMTFPDIQFRNGDKFEISTVSGNLHVTVKASSWMPEGKSLLYEVLRHGTFFRLLPGENQLQFTADTNPDFISCELSAPNLYGGI